MSKKSDRIAKRAAATVAKRHAGEKVTEKATDSSMPQAVTKPARAARAPKEVKEGALPALPKLPSSARARKERPTQPCACGCETPTTGMWAPGHDARAKGWALRIARPEVKNAEGKKFTIKDVPANEQAGAKLMLKFVKDGKFVKAEAATTGPKLAKGKSTETVAEVMADAIAEPAAEAVNE